MSFEIYTVCNDRMIVNLAALGASIKFHNPDATIKFKVIPFDDDIALTERLCQVLGAELVKPLSLWDDIGKRLFKNEEYRPGVFSWRYFRKLNPISIAKGEYIFLDANVLVLNSLDTVLKSLSKFDFVFGTHSIKGKNFRNWLQTVVNVSNPKVKQGFNAGFWVSRGGSLSDNFFETLSKSPELRKGLSVAPEQSLLSLVLALRHKKVATLSQALPTFSNLLGENAKISFFDEYYWHQGRKDEEHKQVIAMKWNGSYHHIDKTMPNTDIYKKYLDLSITMIMEKDIALANEIQKQAIRLKL